MFETLDLFDRLAAVIDGQPEADVLEAIQEHRVWAALAKAAVAEAENDGDVISSEAHSEEIADLEKEIEKLENEPDLGSDAERLHDAICEGRRQDAIDILNDITGDKFRSVREQHSLFPGRVQA